jgi:hypothetical protein
MECENHPGTPASVRCVRCGKYLCKDCASTIDGRMYCENCAAAGPDPDSEFVLVRTEDLQIARAFTFFSEDERWWLKMLIGALFMLASVLVVPFFFVLGYQVALIRAVADGDDARLPEWDHLGRKFADGASVFLISLLYGLPMIIVLGAVVVLGVLAGRGTSSNAWQGLLIGIAFVGFAIGWLIVVAYTLLLRLAAPAIRGTFARTRSIHRSLQLGVIIGLVRTDFKAYLLVFAMTAFVTSTIAAAGAIACCVGLLFTTFYAIVVNAHLIGQLTRLNPIRGKTDGPAT